MFLFHMLKTQNFSVLHCDITLCRAVVSASSSSLQLMLLLLLVLISPPWQPKAFSCSSLLLFIILVTALSTSCIMYASNLSHACPWDLRLFLTVFIWIHYVLADFHFSPHVNKLECLSCNREIQLLTYFPCMTCALPSRGRQRKDLVTSNWHHSSNIT